MEPSKKQLFQNNFNKSDKKKKNEPAVHPHTS